MKAAADLAAGGAVKVFATQAEHIRGLLAKRFCMPEWALFFEVASSTGAGPVRYADAIAMNLWPSRGLALHGFEIKISRADWLSELKNPAKAEAMARNCDHWSIVAAKGAVRDGELPAAWGLIEVDGRGLTVKVQAPKLETPTLSRAFMASLVRRAGEFSEREQRRRVREMTADIERQHSDRAKLQIESATRAFDHLKTNVAEFEKASGLSISGWKSGASIGAAVAILERIGAGTVYSAAQALAQQAENFAQSMKRDLAAIGIVDDLEKEEGFQ